MQREHFVNDGAHQDYLRERQWLGDQLCALRDALEYARNFVHAAFVAGDEQVVIDQEWWDSVLVKADTALELSMVGWLPTPTNQPTN